ncbi:MAG: translation initiation factor IF-2 [Vicinamibacterales bacterium]
MATVRIYKVAEALDIPSQEVMTLLKQAHGIEVKSASSTIEEVVARQFAERLARERGLTLPGHLFAEGPAVKAKAGKVTRAPEPPRPVTPTLGPPRLVKAPKPAPSETGEAHVAVEPEPTAPVPPPPPEPQLPPLAARPSTPTLRVERPMLRTEDAMRRPDAPIAPVAPPAPVAAPPVVEAAAPAEAPAPPAVVAEETPTSAVAATEPAADAVATAAVEPPQAPTTATDAPAAPAAAQAAPVAVPAPKSPVGRIVPPTMRLRVEEGGQAARPGTMPQAPGVPRVAGPTNVPRPTTPTVPPPGARTMTPTYRPTYTPSRTGIPGQTLPSMPGQPGRSATLTPTYRPPGTAPRPPMGGPRPPQRTRPSGPGQRRDLSRPSPAMPSAPPPITRSITLAEGMTVKDLADKLEVKVKDVLKKLLDKRMMMTINTTLDTETATMIAAEFGADVQMRTFEQELLEVESETTQPEDLVARAPVVTVMGHVDHGKTTLLDAIRETRVAEREAGGITQHIGAYAVDVNKRRVVFLDTPGHEAFTLMRARGARVTDVVILVVAADDGVMPQTKEAVDHARAANVPIIVAINKIDKPEANLERVKRDLTELGLMPEDWGGQTVTVPVSAKKRENLELLLEMVLLVTDIGDLKANPKRSAMGTVLEAKLDRGRGPVATVLVQDGTLHIGDAVIAGTVVGKVRALIDDRGRTVKLAGPSTPVEVLGLSELPQPGDTLQSISDAAKARQVAVFRQTQAKEKSLRSRQSRLTLESLQQQVAEGGVKELPIIIKADVQGSAEVLASSLTKLSDERVKIRIIHTGVGAINESDALLASASNAIIIGFNVRPDRNASEVAERDQLDVRLHSVIYNVTDEIKKAMEGLLEPTLKEVRLGIAEVRQIFKVPKFGTVAGCIVSDGKIVRSGEAQARLLRDNAVVYEGKLGSLRRFKDDVSEVKSGLECGIAFERYNDLKVGDMIEVFTVQRVAATV